jgi:hypothetical protein
MAMSLHLLPCRVRYLDSLSVVATAPFLRCSRKSSLARLRMGSDSYAYTKTPQNLLRRMALAFGKFSLNG